MSCFPAKAFLPSIYQDYSNTLRDFVRAFPRSVGAELTRVRGGQRGNGSHSGPFGRLPVSHYRFQPRNELREERIERVWREHLLAAVCSRDSEYVTHVLVRLSGAVGADSFRSSAHGHKLVNHQSPVNTLTPLHYAVMAGDNATVAQLLEFGAAHIPAEQCGAFSKAGLTPLWIAVALQLYEIVPLLLAFGAKFTAVLVDGERVLFHASPLDIPVALGDKKMLTILTGRRVPLPLSSMAVHLALCPHDPIIDVLTTKEVVRWDPECIALQGYAQVCLQEDPSIALNILRVPTASRTEDVFRSLFAQMALTSICCTPPRFTTDSHLRALTQLYQTHKSSLSGCSQKRVRQLLNVCTTPTAAQFQPHPLVDSQMEKDSLLDLVSRDFYKIAEFVCAECAELAETVQEPLTGSTSRGGKPKVSSFNTLTLLPVVLRYCIVSQSRPTGATLGVPQCSLESNGDDKIMRFLFKMGASEMPWLKSLRQLPWLDGKLHDGVGGCQQEGLTAEQCRVSLVACTHAGAVPQLRSVFATVAQPPTFDLGAMLLRHAASSTATGPD